MRKRRSRRDPGTAGIEKDIVQCLTDDLRRAPYKGHRNPLRGHCYVASEALYHLKGGKAAGLKPMFISHEGAPHWFLADTKNRIIYDLTAGQFETPVPYHLAKGKGFLTARPSARAVKVMQRVSSRDPSSSIPIPVDVNRAEADAFRKGDKGVRNSIIRAAKGISGQSSGTVRVVEHVGFLGLGGVREIGRISFGKARKRNS